MFTETLKKIVDNVDGGIGAVIMGVDGIPVDGYTRRSDKADVQTIGTEFSFIVGQAQKAAMSLDLGKCSDISVRAEQVVLLIHVLNEQYFLATVIESAGNYGKARFLMRMAASELAENL